MWRRWRREGWDIDGRFDKEESPFPPVQDAVCMGWGVKRKGESDDRDLLF